MDLAYLTYFVEAAHYKSFTKASQNLHVSQPSISKGIRTLENKWRVRLFHRHGKTIELTDVGKSLLPRVEDLLSQFQNLREEASDPEILQTGRLRVAIPPLMGVFYLVEFLRDFRREYPKIDLEIWERPIGEIEGLLEDGSIHCGFCLVPTERGQHETILISRDKLNVFMRGDHPLAERRKVRGVDLEKYPLLMYETPQGIGRQIIQELQLAEVRPEVAERSGRWEYILGLVEAGAGLAIFPEKMEDFIPRKYTNIVSRQLVEPEIVMAPGLIWQEKNYAGAPTQIFVKYFKHYFHKHRQAK